LTRNKKQVLDSCTVVSVVRVYSPIAYSDPLYGVKEDLPRRKPTSRVFYSM
jgi:hypothetical protein